MTQPERMDFLSLMDDWAGARNPRQATKTLQELISFVEHLEFQAYCDGQAREREKHREREVPDVR